MPWHGKYDPTHPRPLWWIRGTLHEVRYAVNYVTRRPLEALRDGLLWLKWRVREHR